MRALHEKFESFYMKLDILKDILSVVINTEEGPDCFIKNGNMENRFMDKGNKYRMFVCRCFGGNENICLMTNHCYSQEQA